MKILHGYKIVSKYNIGGDDIFLSLLGSPQFSSPRRMICGDREVEYMINEWAKPYSGSEPLTIFKNIDQAKKFRNQFRIRNLIKIWTFNFLIFQKENATKDKSGSLDP